MKMSDVIIVLTG